MKFETINNTLCRMVEPEPLHPDSKMPCMVTRIEDGEIGRYTKWHISGLIGEKLVATSIVDGNVVFTDNTWNICNLPYLYFEIIGYPVVDGSAEWALYQMMQGKWVVHEKAYPCHIHANMITWSNTETPPLFTMQIPSKWVSDNLLYSNSGWQLYEPKQKPAFKVGDWAEFNPGNNPKQVEIVEIDGDKLYYNTMYAGKTIKTHIYASAITRKLDPSEVIVKIGCLSGNVIRHTDTSFFLLHKDKKVQAVIPFTMLDPATCTLVKNLLKEKK